MATPGEEQFSLVWQATLGTHVRTDENLLDMPDDPQKKFDRSLDMFRQGKRRLLEEMGIRSVSTKISTPAYTPSPNERLMDALRIDARKQMLAMLEKSHPDTLITEEKRIARCIQLMISLYPRNNEAYRPLSIKLNETLNCTGASMLGSALLTELNIKHLQATVHRHALLLLVPSDRELYWWDMLNPQNNCEITDHDLEGFSVSDLVEHRDKPTSQGLTVQLTSESFRKRNRSWTLADPMYMHISPPDYGQHRALLASTGYAFKNTLPDAALEAFNIATHDQPLDAYVYYGKGCILATLHRHQEALDAYEEALWIEPENQFFKKARLQEFVYVYGG
ncbi:tetratricopeptide repeat protein [Candidatus Peregrinibacteria bacterium]|nr:tetratricopeptide repeat protein [Candidatus Peregrinibacteria bacterium]